MKKVLLAGVALTAISYGLSGMTAVIAQGRSAADVYGDKCAVCHGEDGAAKTAKGRKLKVKDVRETSVKLTAAQMIDVVTKGKEPDMDPFGKDLGPDMTKQIVDYYRSLAAKK